MVSSWAGAMGQTQFMPTNVVDYAIDFSGDGKSDIWKNVPDVLGSTGNYLHKGHWKYGLPWGFEVIVPKGFDYMKSRASFAEWKKLGVRRADGKAFPAQGQGILFFPAGSNGPGFIVTENYAVLKEYNNSDAYAIAVGHLADRMQGGAPFKTAWPADDHPLSRDARIALQKKLSASATKSSTSKATWILICVTISAPSRKNLAWSRTEIRHAALSGKTRAQHEMISVRRRALCRPSFSASSLAISSR